MQSLNFMQKHLTIQSLLLIHRCPEHTSIPSRSWKSNLGLIMVSTWKSMKIYVGIRKNRPFQGKKKVTGCKGRISNCFRAKNEKNAGRTLYRLARIFILSSYDSLKTNSSDGTSTKFSHAWPLQNRGKGKILLRHWSSVSRWSWTLALIFRRNKTK